MKLSVANYTFDASAKTVTFTDINPILLEAVLLVVNVTDQIIIYNFADPAKGGTVATNVLTLEFDTTSMDDTDKLLIFYEDSLLVPAQENGNLSQAAISLAALEILIATGNGTLDAILTTENACKTALQIIDDWDETDRAKVNPIVGQAGVAAGAGAVGTNVQRTTLASDDPAVVVLGATTGAAVVTDANGTIQQYLRGLVKLFITAGSALVTAVCGGDVAHDGADGTTKPVKIGYKAIAHGSTPAAVAVNDRSDAVCDRHGVPWVNCGHPYTRTFRKNYTAAQTNITILTPTAGKKLVITRCSAMVANSNSVDVSVTVGLAATTTPTDEGTVLSHPGLAKGSGVVEGNGAGELGVGAADDKLLITCSVPTGGSITVVGTYHEIES